MAILVCASEMIFPTCSDFIFAEISKWFVERLSENRLRAICHSLWREATRAAGCTTTTTTTTTHTPASKDPWQFMAASGLMESETLLEHSLDQDFWQKKRRTDNPIDVQHTFTQPKRRFVRGIGVLLLILILINITGSSSSMEFLISSV